MFFIQFIGKSVLKKAKMRRLDICVFLTFSVLPDAEQEQPAA